MFSIQRPVRWMFDALGILQGVTPQTMWAELTPSIDVVQGGWAMAEYRSALLAVPGLKTVILWDSEEIETKKWIYLTRMSFSNPDSADKLVEVFEVTENGDDHWIVADTVLAGKRRNWAGLYGSAAWHVSPPGYKLWAIVPALTTQQSYFTVECVRMPVGVKGI